MKSKTAEQTRNFKVDVIIIPSSISR